jgi:glycosyltransferase involved in cell wall biosynthesis
LKIIYFIPNLGAGGAEELLCDLSSEMSNNHDVTLYLTYRHPGSENKLNRINKNVKVKYLINYELNKLSKTFAVVGALIYFFAPLLSAYIFIHEKLRTFDIIHVNLTQPSFYMIFFKILSKLTNSKSIYVQTSHSNYDLLEGISKYINIFSWYFNDLFIYELFQNDLVNFERFMPGSKINYIPFGYCGENTPAKDYTAIPQLADKDLSSLKIFMTITRVRFSDKKIDVMLKAMHEYKKINKDFIFIIGGDGEDFEQAKQLVSNLKLQDNVLFLGYVSNVSELSVIADAYLVAIVGEDSGVSGMQAISNNIAVVGVQTVKGYEYSDGIFFGESPSELASQLSKLDNDEIKRDYLKTISRIAEVNCNNQKKFSKLHESLYQSHIIK